MAREVERLVLAFAVAACAAAPVEAFTFHRSFRNGYPREWNVTREQANETFTIKGSSVTFSDGRGRVVTTAPAAPQELFGIAVQVDAGGVVWVKVSGGVRRKIRLADVSMPPMRRKVDSAAATDFLRRLLVGRPVRVVRKGRDDYGTVLGTLWLDGKDVNLALVREGLAYVGKGVADPAYLSASRSARSDGLGIWHGR